MDEKKVAERLLAQSQFLSGLIENAKWLLKLNDELLEEIDPESFEYVVKIQKEHEHTTDSRGQDESE